MRLRLDHVQHLVATFLRAPPAQHLMTTPSLKNHKPKSRGPALSLLLQFPLQLFSCASLLDQNFHTTKVACKRMR